MASFEQSYEDNGRRIAFLDLLLKEHEKNPTEFTLKDIRDEVDTLMFTGHETVALAIFWTCYAMSQNPKMQKKLHEEIDSIIGIDKKIRNQNKCYHFFSLLLMILSR
jgi:cytochrome P450